MSVILRCNLFSALRNAARTGSSSHIKSLTNIRSLQTAPQGDPFKKLKQLSVHQCLLIIENKINTKGKLTGYELECIVEAMQNKGNLRSNQALLLIRCCGSIAANEKPETRMSYCEKIWTSIKASGVELDISHYNAFLKVLMENEQPISPTQFLENITSEGLVPNRVTYQYLLTSYCLKGDLVGATKILEEMKEKGFPLNENIFNALVMGHCIANDISGAEDVMKIMKEKGIFITSKTYSMLLSGLAISGNIEKMRSVISECAGQNIELRGSKFMDVVYYLFLNGHNDYAEELLNSMGEIKHFQDLIILQYRLLHKHHFDGYLKALGLMSDQENLTNKMRLCFRYLGNKEDYEIAKKFKDACDRKGLNMDVMKNVLYYSLMSGNTEKSLRIIEHMHKEGQPIKESYFVPLLKNACENNNLEELLKVVNALVYSYGIEMNMEFIVNNIFDHLKLNQKQMSFIFGGLSSQIPFSVVLNAYISTCLRRKQPDNIKYVLNRTGINVKLNDFLIDVMMRYLKQGNHPGIIIDILACANPRKRDKSQKSEESEELRVADGERLINDFQQAIDKLAIKVFSNCEPSISEMFLNAVMENNLPISTKLVQLIRDKSDNDTAESLKAKMIEQGFTRDETQNSETLEVEGSDKFSLFNKNRKLDNITEMEKLFCENEELQTHYCFQKIVFSLKRYNEDDKIRQYLERYFQKFSQPGEFPSKNLYLESEMVNRGMLKEAITLIDKRSQIRKSDYIILMDMFRPIFERGNVDDLKEIFRIGSSTNVQLITLQNVIDYLIHRDQGEAVVKLLSTLSPEDINMVDLNMHFIPVLYTKRKFELIQKVTKIFEENEGLKNSGSELIFLYACSGNIEKGRELLDTELVAPLQWMKGVRAIPAGHRMPLIENAITILKGHELFQKAKLYEYLMSEYDIANVNPEKALDLWLQLQEENIQPTSRFLICLADILKRNNMEVPFEIPESDEKSKIFLPHNLPQSIKEAIWSIRNIKYTRRGLYKLLFLVREGRLNQDHIDKILRSNKDMNPQLKAVFDNVLMCLEWKKAYDNGKLMDYLNSYINKFDDKTPQKVVEKMPLEFILRLFIKCPRYALHSVSGVLLWAYLKDYPEYGQLVDLLEPSVKESLEKENVLGGIVKTCANGPPESQLKRVLKYLLHQNVFNGSPELKERVEDILNSKDENMFEETESFIPEENESFPIAYSDHETIEHEETYADSDKREEKPESSETAQAGTRTSGLGPSV